MNTLRSYIISKIPPAAKHRLQRRWRQIRGVYRDLRLPRAAKAEAARDRRGLPLDDPGPQAVIDAALEWLCTAQDRSASADGGIARHYSLISGWSTSYPETTGYAIPTLLENAGAYGNSDLKARARRMTDWLVGIQLADGAFQGGVIGEEPVRPVVFNTGQILLGLAASAEFFGDAAYVESMHRAARWLADVQDDDGCWRKFSSPFVRVPEHTYDTHVAWGLLEAARVSGERRFAESGLTNVRWAITGQRPNGWFERCCLGRAAEPLTHTITYTLRGIIEGYRYSSDAMMLDAALLTADAMSKVLDSNGFLPGRLDSNWRPVVASACLTGSAQMACCWFLLFEITGNRDYLQCARRANAFVRRTVRLDGAPEIRGAIKGSFPVDGDYGTYEYLNWAAKFVIDANRMEIGWNRENEIAGSNLGLPAVAT